MRACDKKYVSPRLGFYFFTFFTMCPVGVDCIYRYRPMSRRRFRLLGPRQWLRVPCGGCPRRPLSRRRLRLLGPRQWLPVPCGGCPRRPLSRRRLLLLGPRQWLPVPCGGCPRRPLSRRRLRLLGPRQWLPVPCGGCPYRPIDQVQDGYDLVGYSVYECFSSAFEFDF